MAQVFFYKECIHIELVPHSNFYILYFYTLDYGPFIRYVFQRDCPPALWLALFSYFKMHLFYVHEGLVCLYVGAPCVLYLQRLGDSTGFPRTGVRGGCDLTWGCWHRSWPYARTASALNCWTVSPACDFYREKDFHFSEAQLVFLFPFLDNIFSSYLKFYPQALEKHCFVIHLELWCMFGWFLSKIKRSKSGVLPSTSLRNTASWHYLMRDCHFPIELLPCLV